MRSPFNQKCCARYHCLSRCIVSSWPAQDNAAATVAAAAAAAAAADDDDDDDDVGEECNNTRAYDTLPCCELVTESNATSE